MKNNRIGALCLSLALLAGSSTMSFADGKGLEGVPNSSSMLLNGKSVELEAYNIEGNNYFKLRDLAKIFNETNKKFKVKWNEEKNLVEIVQEESYTANGTELQKGDGKEKVEALESESKILLDGEEVDLKAYNIGGNNFFKLRDICEKLGVLVEYDEVDNQISLDTSNGVEVVEEKPEERVSREKEIEGPLKTFKERIEAGKLGAGIPRNVRDIVFADLKLDGNPHIVALVADDKDSCEKYLLNMDPTGRLINKELVYVEGEDLRLHPVDNVYGEENETRDEKLVILSYRVDDEVILTGFEEYEGRLIEFKYSVGPEINLFYEDDYRLRIEYFQDKELLLDLSDKMDILSNSDYYSKDGRVLIERDDFYNEIYRINSMKIVHVDGYVDEETGYEGLDLIIEIRDLKTLENLVNLSVKNIRSRDSGFGYQEVMEIK